MTQKPFYITTSIPYTNAPPHIGFALEAIQADVMARYHKSLGKEVFFLTGSDEHGLKTKRAAQALGKTADEYADEISQKFKELKALLNLSTDDFIRTTDQLRHLPAVNKLWHGMAEKGDLYKKKFKGLYCAGCEAFKTDKEITDGTCVIHHTPVEEIQEENYFFKLSKYLPAVKDLIEGGAIQVIPQSKKNEVLGMIEHGIEDVSFSRDKEKYWGWFVPGDDSQVIYVWADALPNYISAIGYGFDDKKFATYWPADIHCIGKDIVKFHAIYWPAMLLSLGLPLPKAIFVHGFITVAGQKMSKSLGNVVDPFELVGTYGTDAVRYYLLREITPTDDGDFTYEKFEQRYNADLAGGIGNLVARTMAMAHKLNVKLSGKKDIANNDLKKEVTKVADEVAAHIEKFSFNEALKSIWDIISFCDRYINQEKPWEGKENAKEVIGDILLVLQEISKLLAPFMPQTAEKITTILHEQKPAILFARIDKKLTN